jgi:hypothetical protein
MIDEPTHFTEHSSSLIDLILTNNVGIEDSAALKIALVISFVINSISSVKKSESQFTLNKFCLNFS